MESYSARILCCPQCTALLETSSEHEGLDCTCCSLSFPIRNGVPVLVISEATARPIPTDPEFDQLINQALEAPFHGWDLSWLESRKTTTFIGADNPMQMYDARAADLVAQSTAVLDLGTGDGHRFASYAPFPGYACATESYPPNVPLASDRLGPLGVQVVWADPNCHNSRGPQPGNRWPERRLPFADQTFDLVLASRSAFSPREVARILRPDGTVLTIQGGTEWRGETLADALCGTPPEWTQPGSGWEVGDSFLRAGFHIVDWIEHAWTTTYHDIAAVVCELLHVPWSIVDFDVERYRDRLFALHRRMQAEGGFRTRGYTRLIEARKR